jgi:hypothetical protein
MREGTAFVAASLTLIYGRFLVLFFKKEQKALLFAKRSKNSPSNSRM